MWSKKAFSAFIPFVLTCFLLTIIVRIIEFTGVSFFYTFHFDWLGYEFLGIWIDFSFVSASLLIFYPFFYLLFKKNNLLANRVTLFIISVISVAHITISAYFMRQLTPLDVFLYSYPFEEIFFTITTSDISFFLIILAFIIISLLPIFCFWLVSKMSNCRISNKWIFLFLLCGSVASIFSYHEPETDEANFYTNKSVFFYLKSIHYFIAKNKFVRPLTVEDIRFFQSLYPTKDFVSLKYPLIHQREDNNGLYHQLNSFEKKPNIVYIIVEGLNDAYLHNYRGLKLMPYLSQLKDSSLYWSNCFTLGERSFAVIGNSTGGLPYGELGFTLQEKYPKHLSIINQLVSKDYYAAFYTGQAAWFHQNGPYFLHDHANDVFDNFTFGKKYDSRRIIVGEDKKFFWGFNDKDLFSFSMENLDTLQHAPYFITYFTGSTHSPFAISDEKKYLNKIHQLKTSKNKAFIETYQRYLKSVPFLDDALKDFMATYKKRPDFENTIFIITGDHPMTELPRDGELRKYHVPMIIYSPKLKTPHTYTHTVSHLDLYQTLLDFVENYTSPSLLPLTSTLGYDLFNTTPRKLTFMDGNREMYEYYSNGYFLRKDKLYKVTNNFGLVPYSNETLKKQLEKELENFKLINYHVVKDNKIISTDFYTQGLGKYKKVDLHSPKEISSAEEYINLLPRQLVPNTNLNIELDFNFMKGMGSDVTVVFELKDEKDSILVWQNDGLDRIKTYQFYKKINAREHSTSKNKLAIYIHNPKRTMVKLNQLNILVY